MEKKLGIRAHDLGKCTKDEFADKVLSAGFDLVQLVIPKALFDASYDLEYIKDLAKKLHERKIRVAMLGAYFNPVHSSKKVVSDGIENFEKNLSLACYFNCDYVGSETGSYNDSPWIYVPKNRTEEGYQETKAVFERLLKKGREVNKTVLIEPADGHIIYSIAALKRLSMELSSDNLAFTIDLFNLLSKDNFQRRDDIFFEALSSFKDRIKIVHLKDAIIEGDKMIQVAPGKGDFNYPLMVERIKEFCPNANLIFEGVVGEDISFSKNYLELLLNH